MALKYAEDIAVLDGCPPAECQCCECTAYRFVHADPGHRNNYLPPAKISPRRKFENDEECCVAHALSLFTSHEQATAYFKQLTTTFPKIAKTIGDHVSSGEIGEDDGQTTPVRDDGHFDLFEDHEADLASKFSLIGPIA